MALQMRSSICARQQHTSSLVCFLQRQRKRTACRYCCTLPPHDRSTHSCLCLCMSYAGHTHTITMLKAFSAAGRQAQLAHAGV